jgi:hypothetical protein
VLGTLEWVAAVFDPVDGQDPDHFNFDYAASVGAQCLADVLAAEDELIQEIDQWQSSRQQTEN